MKIFDYYRPTDILECPVCHAPLIEWMGGNGPCALLVWQQGITPPINQETEEQFKLPLDRRGQLRLPQVFKIYSYDCNVHCVKAECNAPDGTWKDVSISEVLDLKSLLLAKVVGEDSPDDRAPGPDAIVEDIDLLLMEVNSGASFEQYFLWTPLERVSRIVGLLEQVGLSEVAKLTREAIQIAYPSGLPSSDVDRETQVTRFDEMQSAKLVELARNFTAHNAEITKVLESCADEKEV